MLETASAKDKFSSIETRKALAADLKVKPQQVQVWFQNKRQREKTPGELMPPKQSENPNGGPFFCFCFLWRGPRPLRGGGRGGT